MWLYFHKSPRIGVKHFHVIFHITQNGFTSWGWKLGPLSRNYPVRGNRPRTWRLDLPGSFFARFASKRRP